MKSFQLALACAALLLLGAARPATAVNTIAEAVVANKDSGLGILLAAVQAADPSILALLSDPAAKLTVFAPTDDAFLALLEALNVTPEELLANTALLNTVLAYHVLGVPVASADLKRHQVVQTLLPGHVGRLAITKKWDRKAQAASVHLFTTSRGTANVVTADIAIGHSFVHIIDSVLVPATPPPPKSKGQGKGRKHDDHHKGKGRSYRGHRGHKG